MTKVRIIPFLVGLFLALLAACSTPTIPRHVPISVPAADSAVEKQQPSVPEGFIGDRANETFHRIGCPHFNADPSLQMFFVTPYDALNDNFAPCTYCDPMRGWE